MIEEIHVINLDTSVNRFKEFRNRNAHLGDVTRVSGIEGSQLNRDSLIGEGTITSDRPYLPGSLGCSLSRIRLWQRASAENRELTVLDDDVICVPGLRERAQRVISKLLPDWDIIILCF